MTKQDYLTTWGYLQMLKDHLDRDAKKAAASGSENGGAVAADYLKMYTEISAMQEKIDREGAKAPEK